MIQLPPRIARLTQDSRGYPIPWNVLRDPHGAPIFTVNDTAKDMLALRRNLCPICGERLGKWKWFVGGPKSAFDPNGSYYDLPGHLECIQFALQTCPYLAVRNYQAKIPLIERVELPPGVVAVDVSHDTDRPLVFVMVASRTVEIRAGDDVRPYLRLVKPWLGVQFWRFGKQLDEAVGRALAQEVLGVPV